MSIPGNIHDFIAQATADIADDGLRGRVHRLAEQLYRLNAAASYYRDDSRKMRARETLMIQQLREASEVNLRLTRLLQRTARRVTGGVSDDVRTPPAAPKRFA